MTGDVLPTAGVFECSACSQRVLSDDHFNACPCCDELMETLAHVTNQYPT